jgi:hypothetical protein
MQPMAGSEANVVDIASPTASSRTSRSRMFTAFSSVDPTVSLSALKANWVDDARVLYIGKADSLNTRIRAMAAFGHGIRAAHLGGRVVWQLKESPILLVGWRPLRPGFTPLQDETDMIDKFRTAYGQPPLQTTRTVWAGEHAPAAIELHAHEPRMSASPSAGGCVTPALFTASWFCTVLCARFPNRFPNGVSGGENTLLWR